MLMLGVYCLQNYQVKGFFLEQNTQPALWGQFQKRFCALTPNFCALCPTLEKLFTGAKVWRKARKFGLGRKTVYEIDPSSALHKHFSHKSF